jgi:hypothetical protein
MAMGDLAFHLRYSLRPGAAGAAGRAAFVDTLRSDASLRAAVAAERARLDGVIAARGEQACFVSARDARLLADIVREAGL